MDTRAVKIRVADVSPLTDAKLFARYYAAMPEYRKLKIDRYHFDKDKRLSLGVGILLNEVLFENSLDPKTVKVETNAYEKPFFPDYPDIQFSLSHSDNIAMCASADVPIGCDVECADIPEAVALRVFTLAERENASADDYLRLWTLKESRMKAEGLGFSLPPNSFSIELNRPVNDGWGYCELKKMFGCRFACCLKGYIPLPKIQIIDLSRG